MNKKAIILDLDNTIYPVSSIGEEVFKPVLELIQEEADYKGNFQKIKQDLMRIPFQKIAKNYRFSKSLTEKGIQVLRELSYEKEIKPFDDYEEIKKVSCKKFLVTTGFEKLQKSKIRQLKLDKDFDGIYVVDPEKTSKTKKDIFREILSNTGLKEAEVLVVGDDLESEVQAAKELDIEAVLYDKINQNQNNKNENRITDFKELHKFL